MHSRFRSVVPLLVALALPLLLQTPSRADEGNGLPDQTTPHMVSRRMIEALKPRVSSPAAYGASGAGETTWVGRRAGQAGNYWEVGVGPNRPGINSNGSWTWEQTIHGDSLQGWWSTRMTHGNASGATRVDLNRPWWAIEEGNTANYVSLGARSHDFSSNLPGNRTTGVVGVWHSDPGNTGAGAGFGVAWSPLTLSGASTKSAWMGLRNHGDNTAVDPLTGNAFNVDVLMFTDRMTYSTTVGNGAAKRFPGYGSQMDQMLYRDIDVSGIGANNLTLSFDWAANLSTGKNTTATSRVGWFDGDPIKYPVANDGNFISAEAGSPANTLCPVDSFQVYIGEPVEGSFTASDGVVRPVYDNLRRWFNEIVNKNKRKWVFSATGATAATGVAQSVVIPNADVLANKSAGNRLRVVFRVHTNRGFDDEGLAYNSGGRGAVELDNVKVDQGAGAVLIGDFETPATDIDNNSAFTAEQRWKSTGKPPAIYVHPHSLSTLQWADVCGPPNNPIRVCDMGGMVISMGNHEAAEAIGSGTNLILGDPESEGQWAFVSPTINLMTSGPSTPNGWDLTGDMVAASDYAVVTDVYTGVLDVFSFGVAYDVGMQCYPSTQPAGGPAPGTPEWGAMRGSVQLLYFDFDKECIRFYQPAKYNQFLRTSNASGIPDSVRVYMNVTKTCYRFGVTAGCTATDGLYFDNVALALIDDVPASLAVQPADWFADTFPVNETVGLPGTAFFDTASAVVRTGRNITQHAGSNLRFDVPGDSIVVVTGADSVRVDLVFRIRPGVGNYVNVGFAGPIRKLPTNPAAASPGDGSFWGSYEADPGAYATPGAAALHAAAPGGWNTLVWNSARCDTQETNYFPVSGKGYVNVDVTGAAWQTTLHESDPHYAVLGIPRNKCFVVDTLGTLVDPNVDCDGTPPAWVTTLPASRTGYDGNGTTIEGTSIFPDGLFTPGAHVQYFFRRTELGGIYAGQATLMPDTNVVYPQVMEQSLDGHRWQQFGVLPDRWKAYEGGPATSMLVVDLGDGRGDELAWVSIADSIGMTTGNRIGAANGWHALSGVDVNNPAGFVHRNAQPGTYWDMFGVKGADTYDAPSSGIGSRLTPRNASPANKVNGKYSTQGPTLEMLAAYYRAVFLMSSDLNRNIIGPFTERSQDDVKMIQDFLAGSTVGSPRGIYVSGQGFAEAAFNSEPPGFIPEVMLNNYFGTDMQYPWYRSYSGNPSYFPDLTVTPALVGAAGSANVYSFRNECVERPDVLQLGYLAETVTGANYPAVGAHAPYVGVSVKPSTASRPWVAIEDGFGVQNILSRFGTSTRMRNSYFCDVFSNAFAGALPGFVCSIPTGGVDPLYDPIVDFARITNNPLVSGVATFQFGLAKADLAEIRVYDVSGRLVRTIANRVFAAGAYSIAWNGVDDRGQSVPRGVYFAKVRYRGGFESANKLVVLK